VNKNKLLQIPKNPGVYLMKNNIGKIIYVGKAKNLSNRVKQYFQKSSNHTPKIRNMIKYIDSFETIVTDTEVEALILESTLIKKYRPKYNAMMKDDKSYPYLKISLNDQYPKLSLTRNYVKDGSKYFGPYSSGYSVKNTIELLNETFQLKQCNKKTEEGTSIGRPCLYSHIDKCCAPCKGNVSLSEYRKKIEEVISILSNNPNTLLEKLNKEMVNASKQLDFEEAAKIRDRINGIKHITERQKMSNVSDEDYDIIALDYRDNIACVQLFFIRKGNLIGRKHYYLENIEFLTLSEIINIFIKQYYIMIDIIPRTILIEEMIEDKKLIESLLKKQSGKNVSLVVPQKGKKAKLLDMVKENARISLEQKIKEINRKEKIKEDQLISLTQYLDLSVLPKKIEAYDISNIQGTDNVGGMIVFENGIPNKKLYRRFKIKNIDGQNDYGSMSEMIFRRIEKGMQKNKNFLPFPDLIMLDGGLGHVNAINSLLEMYDINIPVCGLVKDNKHKIRGVIYKNKEFNLEKSTPLGVLLNQISEEVHRFAISYHHVLRKQQIYKSQLNNIAGIGNKRKEYLLKHFKSIDKIKEAEIEDILDVQGMDRKSAQNVYEYFNNN
jgi:excinuclease ABC subunit C